MGAIQINKEVFDFFPSLLIVFFSAVRSSINSCVCVHAVCYLFSFTTVVYYSFYVFPPLGNSHSCRCVRDLENSATFMLLFILSFGVAPWLTHSHRLGGNVILYYLAPTHGLPILSFFDDGCKKNNSTTMTTRNMLTIYAQ